MSPIKTLSRYQQLAKKFQRLDLDVAELLSLQKKQDAWQRVRGLLPKRPSGLTHQRRERHQWV